MPGDAPDSAEAASGREGEPDALAAPDAPDSAEAPSGREREPDVPDVPDGPASSGGSSDDHDL
jgi:hypothetical protein